MKREHEILPTRKERRVLQNERRRVQRHKRLHHLQRTEILSIILVASILCIITLVLFTSKLRPTPLTGRAINQTVATGVNVTQGTTFTCNFTLPQGTAWYSFPCLPNEIDREEFLENFSDNGANIGALFSYKPLSSRKWNVYNASLPNYTVQTLSVLGNYEGIAIVMDAEERFVYTGFPPQNPSVGLRKGWNFVGYLKTNNDNFSDAITTLNDTYTLFEGLNSTEEEGSTLFERPPAGGDNLTLLEVYKGYWVNTTSADVWILP